LPILKKVDVIILGQGLSGTCLALSLLQRGLTVMVFDPQDHIYKGINNASRSAAGLFNPVTGRKMVKTWMADELFSGINQFYREKEKQLKVQFFYPVPIYRPFLSIEDQNDWIGAEQEPEHQLVVDQVITSSMRIPDIHDPFGGLLLKNCGYVDIPAFLDGAYDLLNRNGQIVCESYDESHMYFENDQVIYAGKSDEIQSRWVINCTGASVVNSPYWDYLKFRPVKGEWLKLDMGLETNYIINRGVFMIQGNGHVRVGATYDHGQLDNQPTEKGKNQLIDKLRKIYKGEYRILDQRAGVRPATYDRRPFVGLHPTKKNLAILNGLGAKGVTLAPYFAEQLAEHLINNKPLIRSVSTERC
jgi:glycine oxidase